SVDFLGGRSDLPAIMQSVDLLLHPARHEVAGHVIAEALTVGLPALASGECGYAQLLRDHGGGVALPLPYCQSTFDQRLSDALSDETLRQQWRDQTRAMPRLAELASVADQIAARMSELARQRAE
ncbi:glycosyltransferase, partial [Gammaproteobacteria bacterium]|nr:glycosyltransferase [Gammaproteobacteria bacterium]